MAKAKIASLWIGPELSWLEQLCLKSFVDAGHETTLFSYDTVKGVPEGVKLADASKYLPAKNFIRHARTGSPAYHADVFRLRMIKESTLTWVDTDAYCVKEFNIPRGGHLHGWISDRTPQINNGVLKLPKSSKTLRKMLDFTSDEYPIPPWFSEKKQDALRELKEKGQGVHVSLLPWGVWGPNALTHFLHETGEVKHSQPGHVLYPIPFVNKRSLLLPRRRGFVEQQINDETLSIHFWGRRFRAAVSEFGGIPPRGSYTTDLLLKHNIDPAPTAHLMKPVGPALKEDQLNISELKTDMFTDADIVNLCMQRSSAVKESKAIRAWIDGDDGPLLKEATENRDGILQVTFDELADVFKTLGPAVEKLQPKRVADIGAGYAFIDLMLYRKFKCDLVLIDIEDSKDRHFGYQKSGAGYSSLKKAKEFLVANGVPKSKIKLINPDKKKLTTIKPVDLAISLISCGFHYPANTYETFYKNQVAENGAIILDIRKGSGGIPYMKKNIGETQILSRSTKSTCVLVQKGL